MRFSAPTRSMTLIAATLAVASCVSLVNLQAQDDSRGRKYKAPPPVSHIVVQVYSGKSQKPVENAAVIFHTVHEGKDQGNMELKTDEDGKATLDLIPMGDQVQLQVFKVGFKTYGEDFVNTEDSRDLTVHLTRPNGQYSTYQSTPVQAGTVDSTTPQSTSGASTPVPH